MYSKHQHFLHEVLGLFFFKFCKSFGKDLFIALHPLQRKTHFKKNEAQTAIQAFTVFSALFKVLVINGIYKKCDYFHAKTVMSNIF